MHGDGNGGNGAEGVPRPSLEEVIASFGEPRDRLDRLAIFIAQESHDLSNMILTQTHAVAGMMREQSDAMIGLMKFIAERITQMEAEIARLKGRFASSTCPPSTPSD